MRRSRAQKKTSDEFIGVGWRSNSLNIHTDGAGAIYGEDGEVFGMGQIEIQMTLCKGSAKARLTMRAVCEFQFSRFGMQIVAQ